MELRKLCITFSKFHKKSSSFLHFLLFIVAVKIIINIITDSRSQFTSNQPLLNITNNGRLDALLDNIEDDIEEG